MAQRTAIVDWCAQQLAVHQFRDYCPNGLQVEGRQEIQQLVCAVTASQAAIDFAVAQKADMLLVHHGLFWKSEAAPITGWKQKRIHTLLTHDINLVGYHLPLDAHPEWGNNAQLARQLNWQIIEQTGEQALLTLGQPASAMSALQLAEEIEQVLQRKPTLITANPHKPIQRLGWCTGGGQHFFQAAIDAGVDAYITGEISEPQYHLAHETGVGFIAAGHHATERYGVQALANAIADAFSVTVQFFDEANPA
ncbi:Nif3-like dinuclear metal center hexameric protein [Neisseriaceae bacterium ESL0693]|nr:Nif3-like dinuclear metal center hexameric protein [Neisseriaceae bacterium ESL0693]